MLWGKVWPRGTIVNRTAAAAHGQSSDVKARALAVGHDPRPLEVIEANGDVPAYTAVNGHDKVKWLRLSPAGAIPNPDYAVTARTSA